MIFLKKILGRSEDETVFQLIYFYCICLLLISLPNSIRLVSISQILMGANWLAEGQYREKFNRFFNNRPALIISSVYLIYLIGIFWTQDLAYGIGYDLKNKIPLLTLTFMFASSRPLPTERLKALPVIFSLAVLVTSFIGFGIYLGNPFIDPRELSPFISHIYVSMMVVFVIFLLPFTVKRLNLNVWWFWLSLAVSAWLLFYLKILGTMTGLLCLAGVLLFLFVRHFFFTSSKTRKALAALILTLGLAAAMVLTGIVLRPLFKNYNHDQASLIETTPLGNYYSHNLADNQRENGHLVHFFVAEAELREAWNERSHLPFDSLDLVGHELRVTLLRFLSSKGLRKDQAGVDALQSQEIEAIENGVANYLYLHWPNVLVRLHQTFWEINEYARTGNPSGHSFAQRLELWRAAWLAFKKHPVFGWGTGDVFMAMEFGLNQIDSPLENYRMKPHNQPLILLLMIGVIGLVAFFALVFAFVKTSKAYLNLPFNIMLVVVLVAMLGNNLIDFQIGLTFFLFFMLFYGILSRSEESDCIQNFRNK